uniref:ABC1 atypical kinase-like domain-containing protein n=1 Tax=Glossina austeni TaxID=7395 RepID=A0A1A9VX89_GLOAU
MSDVMNIEINEEFTTNRAPSLRWLEVNISHIENSKSYGVKFEKIFKKCVQLEVLIIKTEAAFSRNGISKAIVTSLPEENCLKTIDFQHVNISLWEFVLQKWSKSLECVRCLGFIRYFNEQWSPFNDKLRHLELYWCDWCENFLNVIAPKKNTMNLLFQVFMKSSKTGKAELVLLDHGLYEELPAAVRKPLCEFWEATVLKDEHRMFKSARKLGINDYMKFAEVLFQHPPGYQDFSQLV